MRRTDLLRKSVAGTRRRRSVTGEVRENRGRGGEGWGLGEFRVG